MDQVAILFKTLWHNPHIFKWKKVRCGELQANLSQLYAQQIRDRRADHPGNCAKAHGEQR